MSISIEDAGRKPALIFSGVVVEQALELRLNKVQLTLKLKHALVSLESSCRSQVFADMSAQEIVSKLLREQDIACRDTAGMTAKQEQLIQFRCSDWAFMRSLLDANGAWLLPDPDMVRIIRPRLADTPDHTFRQSDVNSHEGRGSNAPLIEAHWQFNDQYQPKELKVTAWDIAQQHMSSATAAREKLGTQALNPAELQVLNAAPWTMGSSISVSQNTLQGTADSILQHLQEGGVQGQFKTIGTMDYQLGQTLALSGFGKRFDGLGIVTGISHNLGKAEWTTVVSLGMRNLAGALAPLPTISGLQVGVVAAFQSDPNHLERVRVSLPVLGENNNVVWARLAMPYASKEAGFHFYPEPGDEVVVGFFDDNPCFPAIVGSMYNPINKPPVPMSKENSLKGITLKKGELSLQFDSAAKSAAIVADKDSVKLHNGVEIKGKRIDMDGGAGGVEIKGSKVNLVN
ncbi:phage baseplate assembly protein V [Dyella choica]|uniref:phage baseplate assembly protein V n=1 Tax=Dyella choica TaxID=1927959 RepID=UPI001E5AD163|nr:phage baseplate assembly protein V [Dyella choica]